MKSVKIVLFSLLILIVMTVCSPNNPPTGGGNNTGTTLAGFGWLQSPTVTLSGSGIVINYQLNEPGGVYFGMSYTPVATPNAEQLMSSFDGDNIILLDFGYLQTNRLTRFIPQNTANTQYWYFVAEDSTGHLMDDVVAQSVVYTGDTTPPTVTDFHLIEGGETYLDVGFTLSEYTGIYAVIIPAGDPAPSANQIRNQQDSAGHITAYGILTSASEYEYFPHHLVINGNPIYDSVLTPSTVYDIYMIAEDATGNRSSVYSLTSQFTGPSIIPTWVTDPVVVEANQNSIKITYEISEFGNVYYVMISNNSPQPSALQIVDGWDANGNLPLKYGHANVYNSKAKSTTFSSLAPGKQYDLYMIVSDFADNISEVKKVNVDTADDQFPSFVSEPKVIYTNIDQFIFIVKLSEYGRLYYIVNEDGEAAPSASQIYINYTGWNQISTLDSYLFDIAAVIPGTDYDIYFTIRDSSSNLSEVVKVDARTDDQLTDTEISTALDSTGWNWTIDGRWSIDEVNHTTGGSSLRSANHESGSIAYIQTDVTGSSISFDWKVSSERSSDLLIFSIDGNNLAYLDGTVEWTNLNFAISNTQTVRWRYIKDISYSEGYDCGWIDNLVVTP